MLPIGTSVRVELDVQPRDRYGRVLAHLHLPDGTSVNHRMVRRGYAVVSVYPPNVRHVERLRAAADSARSERVGLWERNAFECTPADYRSGACRN
jgi:micrococcal nuclease